MKNDLEKELHLLFADLKNNDKNALEKIYLNYKDLIFKIAYSILKDINDAEDIVQNVICKIYKLDKIKLPTRNELSWLYSVTKNETINFYKKRNREINMEDIYLIKDINNEIDETINVIYYNEIIKKMNEKDKEIISLKIISNLSFKTISKILNVPIGTIEWRYYKAIKSLRTVLLEIILLNIVSVEILFNNKKREIQIQQLSNILEQKEEYKKEFNSTIKEYIDEEIADYIIEENNEENEKLQYFETTIKNIEGDITTTKHISIGLFIIAAVILILIIFNLVKNKMKKSKKSF